ncbi:MAG: GTP 3',8-cyclase MoaA [Epsilonproteobacteria bacterium]|nr:GTP 3',8-cyclase MoaA [Campylobacterota bacterium]NPA89684.1 GTP 3',8-cyclase MoaA [Campylobacterota bacterium]
MLIDSFNRKIDYIRVSVTSRCNFRCLYCMPNTPMDWEPRENLLSYEELFQFLKVAIDEGVKKVRLTGGEPLIRRDIEKFVEMLRNYAPDLEIALTTNGYYLPELAEKLKKAGLNRVNISLDSLQRERVRKIAQKEALEKILAGIDKALEVGLGVKLNSVIMKGVNSDEVVDLLEFARGKGVTIRFIEFMENSFAYPELKRFSSGEILAEIGKKYKFTQLERDNSPARYFQLEDGYKFGIIEPHKEDFCKNCNRIRLTAEGYLIPCLYFDEAMEIKTAVRQGDLERAKEILREVVRNKPEKNRWSEGEESNRRFFETGG